jgi:hypothetical protein
MGHVGMGSPPTGLSGLPVTLDWNENDDIGKSEKKKESNSNSGTTPLPLVVFFISNENNNNNNEGESVWQKKPGSNGSAHANSHVLIMSFLIIIL